MIALVLISFLISNKPTRNYNILPEGRKVNQTLNLSNVDKICNGKLGVHFAEKLNYIKREKGVLKGAKSGRVKGIKNTWPPNRAINNWEDNQQHPKIAVDSDGNLYCAFDYLDSDGYYDVLVARSKDGGDHWEHLVIIYSDEWDLRNPDIAINSGDTIFVVFQIDYVTSQPYFCFAVSPDGEKWELWGIDTWTWYGDCGYPSIAIKDNYIYVAFQFDYYGDGTDYDIGYVYSDDGGLSWYDYHDGLASSSNHETYPDVSISDSHVGVVYEWWYSSTDRDIHYKYNNGLGSNTWTEVSISEYTNDERYPQCHANSNYFFIVYQVYVDTDWDVYGAYSTDGGVNFTSDIAIANYLNYDDCYPDVYSIDSIVYCVYMDGTTGDVYYIYSNDFWATKTELLVTDKSTAVCEYRNASLLFADSHPRICWTDKRNVPYQGGYDIYFASSDALTKSCDLSVYTPSGWDYPVVPSKEKGSNTVSDTLIGSEPTGVDSTYVDLAVIDSSPVDVPDSFYFYLYVDDRLKASYYVEPLQSGWYAYVEDVPVLIMGGRHTLKLEIDNRDRFIELSYDNNKWAKQWVFAPIQLQEGVPKICKTPPDPWTELSPVEPINCDGFKFDVADIWQVVGIKSLNGGDFNLRLYTDYVDANNGFSKYVSESKYEGNLTDFIVVDGRYGNYSSYYPGVYRKEGTGDYYIEWDVAEDTLQAEGWSSEYVVNDNEPVKIFNVYLDSGNQYYLGIECLSGAGSFGIAIFSSNSVSYIKNRNESEGFCDSVTAGNYKEFTYSAPYTGLYGLVVWNNNVSVSKSTSSFRVWRALSSPLSIGNKGIYKFSVKIAPNPLKDYAKIYLILPEKDKVKIKVYDIAGRMVKFAEYNKVKQGKNILTIDLKDLSSGIYFVSIESSNNRYIEKVTFMR